MVRVQDSNKICIPFKIRQKNLFEIVLFLKTFPDSTMYNQTIYRRSYADELFRKVNGIFEVVLPTQDVLVQALVIMSVNGSIDQFDILSSSCPPDEGNNKMDLILFSYSILYNFQAENVSLAISSPITNSYLNRCVRAIGLLNLKIVM